MLTTLIDATLFVALWATGIGVGALAAGQPRRWPVSRRAVLVAVALNCLAMPMVAVVLSRALALPDDATLGIVLVAAAAGGVLGITTTRIAGGDLPSAVALVIILELLNLVTIPAWLALAVSADAAPPVPEVTRTLLLLILAPMTIGWLVARARTELAPLLIRASGRVASVGLVIIIVGVLWDTAPIVGATLDTGVPVVALTLIAGSLAAGWLAGGPSLPGRWTMGMVTAAQSSALALAIVRAVFGDRPDAVASVIVVGVIGVVIPTLTAWSAAIRRERRRGVADLTISR